VIAQLQKTRGRLRHKLDWQEILQDAAQNGIAPLLYSNLKQVNHGLNVPPEVMQQLKGSYLWHAIHNANLYRRLEEILEAFSYEQIPVIVLKGAALAPLLYKDIALRPMRDLDILVRKADLYVADQLLRKLGYVAGSFRNSEAWYQTHHHHLVPLVAKDGSLCVELHHHIIQPTASICIPIEEFWQRARPTQIGSNTTLLFAPEHLLLHTCLHLAHDDHFIGKLISLCDIAGISRHYKEELDWNQFINEARIYHIQKYVYYALWLAHDMVRGNVPIGALRELESFARGGYLEDRAIKFLIRRFVVRSIRSSVPSWMIEDICRELLSAQSAVAKMKALYQRFCKRFMHSAQQIIPQPYAAALLYALLIHPFYLTFRTARRSRPARLLKLLRPTRLRKFV
jgi:hypothetical protein